MLTGYSLSCTLGRSVLGIGSGVARFLMIAEYATYRYLRCVVNVIKFQGLRTVMAGTEEMSICSIREKPVKFVTMCNLSHFNLLK